MYASNRIGRLFWTLVGAVWMAGVLAIALASSNPARAHFDLEANVRIVHVEHLSTGLRVYIRLPAPYAVAAATPDDPDRIYESVSHFVSTEDEGGRTNHRLIPDAYAAAARAIGDIIADGHQISVDGTRLSPADVQVKLRLVDEAPAFSNLAEAQDAFDDRDNITSVVGPLVGAVLVDASLFYPTNGSALEYTFGSTLVPGVAGQDETQNLLADHLSGTTKLYQAIGTLAEPITVSRSSVSSMSTFVHQGVIHIVEGIDHVLFVLCLALGATKISGLLWRVTGFTIGHSVTLSLGFFGFVPSGDWFVPTVETGIALSIIYAAAVALWSRDEPSGPEWNWLLICGSIGLLHGLGFSFVLHRILSVDSVDVWQSLLAFNIGVEVGQIMIVLVAWPLAILASRCFPGGWVYGRGVILLGCILVSAFWAFDRASSVVAIL